MSDNQKNSRKMGHHFGYRNYWQWNGRTCSSKNLKDAGHTITIFEALPGRGMDSHSIEFDGGIIDAPLRVMNPHLWKIHSALLHT